MLCNSIYIYIHTDKNNIRNKFHKKQSPNYTMNLIKYPYKIYNAISVYF